MANFGSRICYLSPNSVLKGVEGTTMNEASRRNEREQQQAAEMAEIRKDN
jgi:hypothetical protein